MSGSCVGMPSWITEGVLPGEFRWSLTHSSCHFTPERANIPPGIDQAVDGAPGRRGQACVPATTPVDYSPTRPGKRVRYGIDGGTEVSGTVGEGSTQTATTPAARLGIAPGMVVQELGWDDDSDDDLRVAIEDTIDADMVDGDYGNVVDAVLLWWRADDGDLVDSLVDALTDLVGGGAIWLLTPKIGRAGIGRRRRHLRGRAHRGARADDHGRGEQGLDRHPPDGSQDAGVARTDKACPDH